MACIHGALRPEDKLTIFSQFVSNLVPEDQCRHVGDDRAALGELEAIHSVLHIVIPIQVFLIVSYV